MLSGTLPSRVNSRFWHALVTRDVTRIGTLGTPPMARSTARFWHARTCAEARSDLGRGNVQDGVPACSQRMKNWPMPARLAVAFRKTGGLFREEEPQFIRESRSALWAFGGGDLLGDASLFFGLKVGAPSLLVWSPPLALWRQTQDASGDAGIGAAEDLFGHSPWRTGSPRLGQVPGCFPRPVDRGRCGAKCATLVSLGSRPRYHPVGVGKVCKFCKLSLLTAGSRLAVDIVQWRGERRPRR